MTTAVRAARAADPAPVAHPAVSERERRLRQRVAPSAGLALLLAGGAFAVRVAWIAAAGHGTVQHEWLFTAAALVLAGVALVLIALPKIVPHPGDTSPPPEHVPGSGG